MQAGKEAIMASRRSSGEGSVTKRKDGRWMARYTITLPDGTRKRQSIVKKDKEAVIAQMQHEMSLASRGTPINHTKYLLKDWTAYWLKEIDIHKVKETTWHKHKYLLESWVLPEIGNISLQSLKTDHLRGLLATWEKNGLGMRSRQLSLMALSAVMRDAVKQEHVYRNVVRLVDAPKYQRAERSIWTKDQVTKYLTHMKPHRYYGMFLILFTYGLRKGEAFGLRWQDVDFDANLIHVRQQMCRVGKEYKLLAPKAKTSVRDLPMIPSVREVLLAERDKRKPSDTDFLFVSSRGNFLSDRSFADVLDRESRRIGLPRITLHEIRHTVATMFKDSDVPVKEAQTILGHSSITTTLQIYTHSTNEKKTEALMNVASSLGI